MPHEVELTMHKYALHKTFLHSAEAQQVFLLLPDVRLCVCVYAAVGTSMTIPQVARYFMVILSFSFSSVIVFHRKSSFFTHTHTHIHTYTHKGDLLASIEMNAKFCNVIVSVKRARISVFLFVVKWKTLNYAHFPKKDVLFRSQSASLRENMNPESVKTGHAFETKAFCLANIFFLYWCHHLTSQRHTGCRKLMICVWRRGKK